MNCSLSISNNIFFPSSCYSTNGSLPATSPPVHSAERPSFKRSLMTLAEKTTVLLMNRSWIDIDYVKVITKLKLKVERVRSVKWTASFGSKNNAEIESKIHQNLVLIVISERFCLYSQYSWFICFVYPSALLYCIYPASAAPCWCCADFFL